MLLRNLDLNTLRTLVATHDVVTLCCALPQFAALYLGTQVEFAHRALIEALDEGQRCCEPGIKML